MGCPTESQSALSFRISGSLENLLVFAEINMVWGPLPCGDQFRHGLPVSRPNCRLWFPRMVANDFQLYGAKEMGRACKRMAEQAGIRNHRREACCEIASASSECIRYRPDHRGNRCVTIGLPAIPDRNPWDRLAARGNVPSR